MNQAAYDTRSFLAQISLFFFSTAAILPVFLILAWRNLRLGRTDQRVALWYASLVLGTYFLSELVSIRLGESGFIDLIHEVFDGRHLGHAVLHGFQAWLAYLAVEPYVRRIWPRSLVGWTRFAKGRWRDPQVGREVLLGVLLGSLTLITALVVSRLAWSFDWPHASPLHDHPEALHSISWFIAFIIPSWVLINIINLYVWLVIIRQITSSEWAAVAVVAVLKAALVYYDHVSLGGQTVFDPATLIWVLVLSSLIVLAMVRLGLIAAIMIDYTASVMLWIPLSVEFPSDFSTQMVLGLMTLVGLALFGFFVSLGRQPLVRELPKKS